MYWISLRTPLMSVYSWAIKEAAELAQQRAHGALGGADGEFHVFSWP